MNTLLSICAEFCKDMLMILLIPKTYILTNAQYNVSWSIDNATIEDVLVAKYLGWNIRVRGRNLVGLYEADMVKRAKNYAYTVMNLTITGLDRAVIAPSIWESSVIPAILYCCKAICISKKTLKELEQIQNMKGRFILKILRASSRVLA